MPSSKATKKTTLNSNPLTWWMVASLTVLAELSKSTSVFKDKSSSISCKASKGGI